ncbi:unnamed protein product, partial [Brassica rapa]
RILLKKTNLLHAQQSGYSVLILLINGKSLTVSSIVFKPIYFVYGSSIDSFVKRGIRSLLVQWKINSAVQ